MRRINTYIIKSLKFLMSCIKEVVVALIVALSLPIIYSKWGELQSYWRILQDALLSGYVRGIPFQNVEGYWNIAWKLGGSPLIHVAIPYLFTGISLTLGISVIAYLLFKYYSFRKLKQICTYLRNPKNFRKTISMGMVLAVSVVCFFAAFIGTSVDPKIILPNLKPTPDYIGVSLKVSVSCSIRIERLVIVDATPSKLDRQNMNGWFYCIIKAPENAPWSIYDIDTLSIILNGIIRPNSTYVEKNQNGTSLVASFDKGSLLSLFKNQNPTKLATATITIEGRLSEVESFTGKIVVQMVATKLFRQPF